jgi:hypothetical protein
MEWFRFYEEALNDRKVQCLPAELFKAWINLLCLANEGDGVLPPVPDVAFRLRLSETDVRTVLDRLTQDGLIDELPGGALEMHNWSGRQRPSDNSLERVRNYRDKQRVKVLKSRGSDVTLQKPLPKRDSNAPDKRRGEEIREENTSAALQKKALETTQKGWYEQLFSEFWNQEDSEPGWKEFKRSIRTPERFEATLKERDRRLPEMLKREPQYRKTMRSWLMSKPWEGPKGQTPPQISTEKKASSFRQNAPQSIAEFEMPEERVQELQRDLESADAQIREWARIALGRVN